MIARAHRTLLFGLHQLTIALGILLLPVAIATRRAGINLPFGTLVEATGKAYDKATK